MNSRVFAFLSVLATSSLAAGALVGCGDGGGDISEDAGPDADGKSDAPSQEGDANAIPDGNAEDAASPVDAGGPDATGAEVSEGGPTDDAPSDGSVGDGSVTDGGTASDATTGDAATDGGSAKDATTEDAAADSGTTDGGSAKDATIEDAAADSGTTNDATADDAATDAGTAEDATTDPTADASAGDAAGDATTGGGGSTPDAGPAWGNPAASVTQSADTDPGCGELTATITIGKAADETNITSYALYWGTGPSTKLSATPIAVLLKTGSDVTYPFQKTSFPPAAKYVLAYSESPAGENTPGVSTPIVDLGASYVDLSAGQKDTYVGPSALVDAVNGKLLVAMEDGEEKPALFRCNFDGTGCTYADLSAKQKNGSGLMPSAVIDTTNSQLLVATQDNANLSKTALPALYRCNLDGTGCTYTDISVGQPAGSGYHPTAVFDETNGKLLVVTQNSGNKASQERPALFRCNLDGTDCVFTDISAGRPAKSAGGTWPFPALIDKANSKLLVVTDDTSNSDRPALFRCNLDGSDCTYADISAGRPASCGIAPAAVIDTKNNVTVQGVR